VVWVVGFGEGEILPVGGAGRVSGVLLYSGGCGGRGLPMGGIREEVLLDLRCGGIGVEAERFVVIGTIVAEGCAGVKESRWSRG